MVCLSQLLGTAAILAVIYCESLKDRSIRIAALFEEDESIHRHLAFRFAVKALNERTVSLLNDVHKPIHRPKLKDEIVILRNADSFGTGLKICNLTLEGIGAIFGPRQTASTDIVRSVADVLEIPQVVTNWDPTPPPRNYQLNLHPEARFVATALVDVLWQLHWPSYTVLYDSEDGLIRLQGVLQAREPSDPPITVRQLEGEDHRSLLKEIKKSAETHIILDCDTDRILDILRQAGEVGMMEVYQSYFITSLDAHTVDYSEFRERGTNITTLRMVDPNSNLVASTVHDLNDHAREEGLGVTFTPETLRLEVALMYDAVQLYAKALFTSTSRPVRTKRLSCTETTVWDHGIGIHSFMSNINHQGLTGKIHFDSLRVRTEFELYVVEYSPEGFKRIAVWTPESGFNSTRTQTESLAETLRNIQGRHLIVSSRIGPPYLREKAKTSPEREGNDRYEGYSMDLITEIAELLKFTFEFRIVKDNEYGSYVAGTQSWNGLIGELINRRADLAICDLTITFDRESVVDFTMPFMNLGISILYKKSEKPDPNLFSFLEPFTIDVWIYMATAYLGVSVLLFILARATPDEWGNPHPCNPEPEELENTFNMINCLWFSIGSLMAQGCDLLPKTTPHEWKTTHPCAADAKTLENALTMSNCIWHNCGSLMQQGSDIAPQAVSTRMVAGMWWFFTLIMISSYTANLAAFLTVTRMDVKIKSVEDLAKQTKIKYGTFGRGSTASFFRMSNDSVYQRMWTVMSQARPDVFTANNDEGVDRVKKEKGDYAFFMESTTIEYQIALNCDLKKVGGLLDSKGYGIALPRNSPFRTPVSGAVLTLQERGNLSALKAKWWKAENGGCGEEDDEADENSAELGILNVGGVFLVLFFGTVTAFFVAALEFLWNCRKIAVEEKITPWEAIKEELKFVVRCGNDSKPVRKKAAEDTDGSFIHMPIDYNYDK